MSELKAYRFLGQDEVCPDANIGSDYYLKSEADKVIAEKDKEIARLNDKALQYKVLDEEHCRDLNTQERRFALQIAHHKYKRCLAMAERCKYRMYYLAAVVEQEASKIIPLKAQIQRYEKLERRMDYWKNRWLELAEKFKEAK